jgi:hypothetical protein
MPVFCQTCVSGVCGQDIQIGTVTCVQARLLFYEFIYKKNEIKNKKGCSVSVTDGLERLSP